MGICPTFRVDFVGEVGENLHFSALWSMIIGHTNIMWGTKDERKKQEKK